MNKHAIMFQIQTLFTFFFILMSWHTTQTNVVTITNDNQFDTEVLKSSRPVLVKFSANWCGACKSIQKPFEEVAAEPEFSNIKFAHVDVDRAQKISKQNGIIGVPTFIYMNQGEKKNQSIGVENIGTFKDTLRNNIRKTFKVVQNQKPIEKMQPEQAVMAIEEPKETIEIIGKEMMPIEPQEQVMPEGVREELVPEEKKEIIIEELPAPGEMPVSAEKEGILAQIWAFIMFVICKIKEFFIWIINVISGWLGRK